MASTSARAESSTSSSSLPPQFWFDVFLSFRGEDTRKNFTDHLYSALVRNGFSMFRDDDKLKRGEEIGPELLNSIERSRISVIVFSRNYADSRWCLDELVKILRCKSAYRQIVLPVFYHVDPSNVRAQKGSYAEAFAKHEEHYKGRGMETKPENWRAALTEVSNLSGYDLQNLADGHEAKVIEKIVEDISERLNIKHLNVADYPVGIESRVQRVNELLELGSDNVRMVGIWGIGGIGKTTIAKAIYNQIHLQFEGNIFLANVREISKQPSGLVCLQEHILSEFQMKDNQKIRNVDHGIEVIKRRIWSKRVLVVLDDVDDFEQLKALAIRRDWFQPGSRVIVTTRDESLLKLLEVDGVYELELLSYNESFQLFSWHAFGKDHPVKDNEDILRKAVSYAGGLPLVLEVWGSFVKVTDVSQWKSTLERLRQNSPKKIQEKLRISYDSLEDEDKKLFLDIACFFVGMDKNYTIQVLTGWRRSPEFGLGVLSRRCLVRIDGEILNMHDVIQDMGRDIIHKECPKEPGKRSRLVVHEDVLDVLKYYTGTEAVEGLVLKLPSSDDVQVNAQAFAKMSRLRLLELNYVRVSGSFEHLSKKLRWLRWIGFPLESIPSQLFMGEVVIIDMPNSNLKQAWKGRKVLSNLKILNLSHSHNLTETPDFSGLINLDMLLLNDCPRLVEVHESIECLDKLLVLNLGNCKNLRKLPPGIFKLKSLQNLSLTGCSNIETLPGFKGSPSKSWFSHFSSWVSPMRNPDSISLAPTSMQGLISIRRLYLADCNLSYIPNDLGSLITLKVLNLDGNNFCSLPASIRHLSRLEALYLNRCTRLQSLPELPINLEEMNANHCTALERISIGSNLQEGLISIRRLYLADCNLSYIPNDLGSLITLKVLNLDGNNFCSLPASIRHLSRLEALYLNRCTRLQSLPELPINLEGMNANHCTALERISIGSNLQESPFFTFFGCHNLIENNLASNFRKSILQYQGLLELGDFNIFLPGVEVPDWFTYQSVGSVLSFVVSPLPNLKIRGWILCVIYAGRIDDENKGFGVVYHVKNKTKGIEDAYQPTLGGYPITRQDHMWLHYAPLDCLYFQIEAGDEVEFSIDMATQLFQVKKCGINLIYEDDEKDYPSNNLAMTQYASPRIRDVTFD